MAEARIERRLAAILATDVAEYSRLMGVDEEGTLTVLKTHRRELIDPLLTQHHGRVFKTTGDGILIEFASVIDAVRCAIAIQQGMEERNTSVAQSRRILFRMGINLGDIIVEEGDIFGDACIALLMRPFGTSLHGIEAKKLTQQAMGSWHHSMVLPARLNALRQS